MIVRQIVALFQLKASRLLIVPACLVTAAGLATGAPAFPTDQQQAEIAKPYQECLEIEAERIDDGHTDLAVVARSVAVACNAEFIKMIAAVGKDLSPEDRLTLEKSQSGLVGGFAAVFVGKVRAARRASPKP